LGHAKTGWAVGITIFSFVVQIGVTLLVVFHDFASKDAVIIASLLIIIYGMSMASIATESVVSGAHFVALVKKLSQLERETGNEDTVTEAWDDSASLRDLTKRERPYTLAGTMFGLLIAFIGVVKLVYTIVVS
jgi:hypothetical protein